MPRWRKGCGVAHFIQSAEQQGARKIAACDHLVFRLVAERWVIGSDHGRVIVMGGDVIDGAHTLFGEIAP